MNEETKALRMLWPIRDGSKISVCINGQDIELTPLMASELAKAWQAAIGGAYVHRITKHERI